MKYTVPESTSLLNALTGMAPECSKTTLRSWLKDGRVTVDNIVVKLADTGVLKGQVIALGSRQRFIGGGLRIYYEDKHLVIIEKPSGLLSVSTAFEKEDTAHGLLKEYYRPNKVFVVHRLDQDTSGVMMFALSEQANDRLKEEFEQHRIQRSYTAVVEGYVTPSEGTWQSYLYEDANYFVRSTASATEGRLAITHYDVQLAARRRSLLNLRLETGRKNQIRVHCQDAGYPVAGDKKYGAQTNPIKRLCLHANLLAFTHPITKQAMRIESPFPREFKELFQ
ncbi:MAG: RluA family pseudouridine synthase [Parachlamydiaceae bacterium]|nr:RluA family pseudouridine synthase [Parachlamydiaceae bacterium]